MSSNRHFQFLPFLDKELNRGIGRTGVVFTAVFCLLACAVGYYFIRPWSVFPEEDLRLLGYLGVVAVPAAAWLFGGLTAMQLFMALQVFRWVLQKQMLLSSGVFVWLGVGGLLFLGGAFASYFVEPFYYGFLGAIAGVIIFFRTTGSIWAWRIFAGRASFPPDGSRVPVCQSERHVSLPEFNPGSRNSDSESKLKVPPYFGKTKSGNTFLVLETGIDYDSFASAANRWAEKLGLAISSRADGIDARVWECERDGARFWLAHDHWFPTLSLEPKDAQAAAEIKKIGDGLCAKETRPIE